MVKKVSPESPATPESSALDLYSAGDPIPVPEVIESDADAAWALWEDSISPRSSEPDIAFENTVPADLPTVQPATSTNPPKPRP